MSFQYQLSNFEEVEKSADINLKHLFEQGYELRSKFILGTVKFPFDFFNKFDEDSEEFDALQKGWTSAQEID